jgi:hypothetical protein
MYRLYQVKNLAMILAIAATVAIGAPVLHAQIIGEVEAKIPFAFSVDNTTLPAGDYTISPTEENDPSILWLQSADGNVGVLIATQNTQATQLPKSSELVFDKVGNRHFLRQIWLETEPAGYDLMKSKTEIRLEKSGTKAEQHRLTVKHNKAKTKKY